MTGTSQEHGRYTTGGHLPAERSTSIADATFRVLFSLIFIVGGIGHFVRHEWMMSRLDASPWVDWVNRIGDPATLMYASGAVLSLGGTLLLLGVATRVAAAALLATILPITFVIHIAPDHVGPLLKNLALMGGLVHFFVHGPGAFSLENARIKTRLDEEAQS